MADITPQSADQAALDIMHALVQVRELKHEDRRKVNSLVKAYVASRQREPEFFPRRDFYVDVADMESLEEKLVAMVAMKRDPTLGAINDEKLSALLGMANELHQCWNLIDKDIWNQDHPLQASPLRRTGDKTQDFVVECLTVWFLMFHIGENKLQTKIFGMPPMVHRYFPK